MMHISNMLYTLDACFTLKIYKMKNYKLIDLIGQNVISIGLNMKNKKVISKGVILFDSYPVLLSGGIKIKIMNTEDLEIKNKVDVIVQKTLEGFLVPNSNTRQTLDAKEKTLLSLKRTKESLRLLTQELKIDETPQTFTYVVEAIRILEEDLKP